MLATGTTDRHLSRARQAEKDLLASASIEMAAHEPDGARRIADLLPAATSVYVNHMPRNTLGDLLGAIVSIRRAGLEPVPHLVARRIGSENEFRAFLLRARDEADIRKVLLLGGDSDAPAGPYGDALSLLDFPLQRHGIREVGFAGYPEGHPRIAAETLASALQDKIARAQANGLSAFIVTQFSFAPQRIVNYCAQVKTSFPSVPVFVGVPGPTNPLRLIKFAQACGVNASLRALTAQGFGAVKLVTHTDPSEQLGAIARHMDGATSNVTGLHVYSFGGVPAAARWISATLAA